MHDMLLIEDYSGHEEAEKDVPANDNDVIEGQFVPLCKSVPDVEACHDAKANSCINVD